MSRKCDPVGNLENEPGNNTGDVTPEQRAMWAEGQTAPHKGQPDTLSRRYELMPGTGWFKAAHEGKPLGEGMTLPAGSTPKDLGEMAREFLLSEQKHSSVNPDVSDWPRMKSLTALLERVREEADREGFLRWHEASDEHKRRWFAHSARGDKAEAEALRARVADRPTSLPCGGCGGPHRYDTSVPSVLWNAVIRAKGLSEFLCASCILEQFVLAGSSFTAELWGDGLPTGQPIEVRVGGQVAEAAAKIGEENTALRARLSEAEAEKGALRRAWDAVADEFPGPQEGWVTDTAASLMLKAVRAIKAERDALSAEIATWQDIDDARRLAYEGLLADLQIKDSRIKTLEKGAASQAHREAAGALLTVGEKEKP